jgi:hypothetical protein
VIGAFREKGIGRIRISRSCRIHRFYFTYPTCYTRAAVAFCRSQ